MRTTDPAPEPWKPLGERIQTPRPSKPDWQPVPGKPEMEQHRVTGKLRTALPLPK